MTDDLELLLRAAAHRIPDAPLPSLDDAASSLVSITAAMSG